MNFDDNVTDMDYLLMGAILADGWNVVGTRMTTPIGTWLLNGQHPIPKALDDALAAQLCRQIRKLGFKVHTYGTGTFIAEHHQSEYQTVVHGSDVTMNDLKACVQFYGKYEKDHDTKSEAQTKEPSGVED